MTALATRPPASFLKEQRDHARDLRRKGESVEAVNTALKERAEKCGYGWDDEYAYVAVAPSPYVPLGGATSFAGYDEYQRAVETEYQVNTLTWTFHDIVDNIFASSMSLAEKASAVAAAAADLQTRMGEVPEAVDEYLDVVKGSKEERHGGLLDRILRRSKKEAPAAADAGLPSVTPTAGVFRTFKDGNGDLRWLAVYSNCFKDVDGETFSYAAHQAYVQYVDATKDYPELWLWHTPGTKCGKADVIDLTSDGFMLASGPYDQDKKEVAEKLAAMGPLGVSHGFDYVKERGLVNGVYQPGYKTFEISPLPAERAANPITAFVADTEEVMSLSPVKKEFLSGLGIDTEALEKNLSAAASKAKEAGHEVTFKELAEALQPEPATATAAAPVADMKEAPATEEKDTTSGEKSDDMVAMVKEAIGTAMAPVATAITELRDAQAKQAEAIAQLQKSDDDKIAAMLAPRARPGGGYVASEAKDSVVDGRTAAAKAAAEGILGVPEHLAPYAQVVPGLKEMYVSGESRG